MTFKDSISEYIGQRDSRLQERQRKALDQSLC